MLLSNLYRPILYFCHKFNDMALILSIETATPVCSAALLNEDGCIMERFTTEENAHSRLLTVYLEGIMKESGYAFSQLDAVAVSEGPGSYTGLRIGVSAAKGICYAQDIPLISVSTLQSMAAGMQDVDAASSHNSLYLPMIDARRMEVYAAVFDHKNRLMRNVMAEILDETTYTEYMEGGYRMVLAGNGAEKTKTLYSTKEKVVYLDEFRVSACFAHKIAFGKYRLKDFADTAYFEPFYLKAFVAGKPKVKGLYS